MLSNNVKRIIAHKTENQLAYILNDLKFKMDVFDIYENHLDDFYFK